MRAAAEQAAPRAQVTRGRLPFGVHLLAFCLFAMGSAEFLVAGVLPAIADDLHITLSSAGALISAFAIGVVMGGPPSAILTLHWPRRTTLIATQAIFAVSVAAGLLTDSYTVLIVTRFLCGLAYAGFFAVSTVTAISLVTPDRTARASGVVVSGLSLAMTAGGPAGALISHFTGWRGGFWVVVVLTVLGALSVLFALSATSTSTGTSAEPSMRRELSTIGRPQLWVIYAITILSTAAYMVSFNYLAAFLTDVTGIPEVWVPAILALFGVGAFIGLSIGGRIADRQASRDLMTGTAGILVCSVLLALLAPYAPAVVPLVLLLGVAGFVVNPAIFGRVFTVARDAPTLAGATTTSAFQLGTGLTPALRASGALTTSLSSAVYERLPNETDLTIFDEAGTRGLNFAFMDGSAHYHTEHDSISRLDRASVQDMGDAALAAARRLGGADLSQNGTDTPYFSLFGTIVSYPAWLTPSLAVMAVLGMFLLLWFGRRRGLSPGGAGRAAATFPLTLIGAAAIGLAGWWVLSRVRPDFALTEGSVHHGGRYLLGGALLLLVLLVAWYRWARRKASPLDIAVGVLGWFALLAVVCAVVLPEGAYLFTWPALIGPAVVAMTLRFTAGQSPWRAVAVTATAVPAVALLLPVVLLLLPALGLSSTAAPLVLAALLGALLLSLLELLPSRRTVTAGMLAVAVAGVGTLVVGTALDGYDADEPRPVSLGYALESDTGKATWVSLGDTSQPDIGELLTGEPARYDDRIPPLGGTALANGVAKAAPLDAPRIHNASTTEAKGVRTVRVRIKAPANAHSIDVHADTGAHQILDATVEGTKLTIDVHADTGAHQILDATVEGTKLTGGPKHSESTWGWSFTYAAPPTEGIDVVIRTRGKGPLPLRVVSTAVGLPDGVGAPALTADRSWATWPSVAGQTFVVRTFRF
ncbi:MFS transporter [Streptomyces sp. NPDC014685]|uniref:MFS transporter n=1 Tax=Streptomyces sp. NPDC014685 TaxID=3364881 RepID=UPI0036FC61CB